MFVLFKAKDKKKKDRTMTEKENKGRVNAWNNSFFMSDFKYL